MKYLNKHNDKDGRFVIIKCMIQDRLFLLANLYNPNKEPQQIEVVDNFIATFIFAETNILHSLGMISTD